ncbi:MAG TPA: pentapeptide repeat-containing protein [Acidimicrobiales bacterium]|nr:pentapeptide repeat-containing protein [Acidimicrobiales bacterium]
MTEPPRLPKAPQTVDAAELLAGADEGTWTDVVIRNARLAGVVVDDARFVDCRFEGCDLAGVRFTRLSMRRVELADCRMTGVDLGGAQLHDVRFTSCKLDDANLRGVRGERVTFVDTVLGGTELALASLEGAVFEACKVAGIDLRRASLAGAAFPECDLTDVLGVDGLKGAHLTPLQALQLAPRLAAELGITVLDDD